MSFSIGLDVDKTSENHQLEHRRFSIPFWAVSTHTWIVSFWKQKVTENANEHKSKLLISE